MTAREHADKRYGTENMEDVSEFMIPLSSAIVMMKNHASKVNESPVHAVSGCDFCESEDLVEGKTHCEDCAVLRVL
jgi:hypothetical protein